MKISLMIALVAGLLLLACNNSSNTGSHEVSQTGTPALSDAATKGKVIYEASCAMCHRTNVGPSLVSALADWNNDMVKMKAFIHNPDKFIADKDPVALKLYGQYGTTMTAFPSLTDEELNELIAYFPHSRD